MSFVWQKVGNINQSSVLTENADLYVGHPLTAGGNDGGIYGYDTILKDWIESSHVGEPITSLFSYKSGGLLVGDSSNFSKYCTYDYRFGNNVYAMNYTGDIHYANAISLTYSYIGTPASDGATSITTSQVAYDPPGFGIFVGDNNYNIWQYSSGTSWTKIHTLFDNDFDPLPITDVIPTYVKGYNSINRDIMYAASWYYAPGSIAKTVVNKKMTTGSSMITGWTNITANLPNGFRVTSLDFYATRPIGGSHEFKITIDGRTYEIFVSGYSNGGFGAPNAGAICYGLNIGTNQWDQIGNTIRSDQKFISVTGYNQSLYASTPSQIYILAPEIPSPLFWKQVGNINQPSVLLENADLISSFNVFIAGGNDGYNYNLNQSTGQWVKNWVSGIGEPITSLFCFITDPETGSTVIETGKNSGYTQYCTFDSILGSNVYALTSTGDVYSANTHSFLTYTYIGNVPNGKSITTTHSRLNSPSDFKLYVGDNNFKVWEYAGGTSWIESTISLPNSNMTGLSGPLPSNSNTTYVKGVNARFTNGDFKLYAATCYSIPPDYIANQTIMNIRSYINENWGNPIYFPIGFIITSLDFYSTSVNHPYFIIEGASYSMFISGYWLEADRAIIYGYRNDGALIQIGNYILGEKFLGVKGFNGSLYASTSDSQIYQLTVASLTTNINSSIISQTYNDIIPFTYSIANSAVTSSTLNFDINVIKNYLDYSQLTNTSSVSLTSQSNVYVPYTEDSLYKINSTFNADILVNGNGVKEYSLRSQENIYSYKLPSEAIQVFNTPRFTWSTQINGLPESEISIDYINGNIWIATNNTIYRVGYSSTTTHMQYSSNSCSNIKTIYQGENNILYISQQDLLQSYYNPTYYDNQDFVISSSVVNQGTMIAFDNGNGAIYGINPYLGQIELRDTSLNLLSTSIGLDSPKKILWSQYHNSYLISGANILWMMGSSNPAYSIGEWKILDFDISEKGNIIIIFNQNNNYIVRILDKDLYTIIYEKRDFTGTVGFCKYCDDNLFYFIENISDITINNYLYDVVNKKIQLVSQTAEIVTTTTTTTLPTPTQKVQIISPVTNENVQIGTNYTIQWSSNTSIGDFVKIELFSGLKLISTIAPSTPNVGAYQWTVLQYDMGSNYNIKITWLSAGDSTNYDISGIFSISNIANATTTTTTTPLSFYIVGIEYNNLDKNIVMVTNNGLIGIFNIEMLEFYGLFDTQILNVVSTAKGSKNINQFTGITKVRVFVGSQPYLSDLWDSGEVETTLTSMYYGGGNNLVSGYTYFVNIQVYSNKYGWSDLQTQQFVMPN